MKLAILIASFAVVSVVAATKTSYGYQSAPALTAPVAIASTGSSSQFRSQDSYGNSNFGYDESHATGATSRREETVNGVTRGSYWLSDADGRRRMVSYIADAHGFRANIQSNEPGVEPKDPADVLINKAVAVAAPAPAPVLQGPTVAPIVQEAHGAVKGYGRLAAASVVGPVIAAGPAPIVEAPRAFSYNIGVSHLAAAAPRLIAPTPVASYDRAPILEQQIVQEQQEQQSYNDY